MQKDLCSSGKVVRSCTRDRARKRTGARCVKREMGAKFKKYRMVNDIFRTSRLDEVVVTQSIILLGNVFRESLKASIIIMRNVYDSTIFRMIN